MALEIIIQHVQQHLLPSIDIEHIRDALDKGEKALGIDVYLVLQKAFDIVDHHILIQKLSHYGISGKCLSWFSSYLSGRNQFVYVNNAQSECKNIIMGYLRALFSDLFYFVNILMTLPTSW